MTANHKMLKAALRFALSEVKRLDENPDRLPAAQRIVVIVHAAQGIIDNGGLRYFFENNFDDQNRPYSYFSEAYRTIGAMEEADLLDAAVRLFPFEEPQKQVAARRALFEQFDDEGPFEAYSNKLCGNERVWQLLDQYIQQHADDFPADSGTG